MYGWKKTSEIFFKKTSGHEKDEGNITCIHEKNQCTWKKTADIGIHSSELHGYQCRYIGRANHN